MRLYSCVSMTLIFSLAYVSSSHLFIEQFMISSFIHRPGTRLFSPLRLRDSPTTLEYSQLNQLALITIVSSAWSQWFIGYWTALSQSKVWWLYYTRMDETIIAHCLKVQASIHVSCWWFILISYISLVIVPFFHACQISTASRMSDRHTFDLLTFNDSYSIFQIYKWVANLSWEISVHL